MSSSLVLPLIGVPKAVLPLAFFISDLGATSVVTAATSTLSTQPSAAGLKNM